MEVQEVLGQGLQQQKVEVEEVEVILMFQEVVLKVQGIHPQFLPHKVMMVLFLVVLHQVVHLIDMVVVAVEQEQ